jgi:putative endonuclease
MAKHNELGKQGEEIAAQYLIEKGYEIVERNWRNSHKEIDIIAKDGVELVIVEVKTRQSDDFGEPDIAVTRQKQSRLIYAANAYLFRHNLDIDTRFDIISIVMKDGNPIIDHIEDAFLPHC